MPLSPCLEICSIPPQLLLQIRLFYSDGLISLYWKNWTRYQNTDFLRWLIRKFNLILDPISVCASKPKFDPFKWTKLIQFGKLNEASEYVFCVVDFENTIRLLIWSQFWLQHPSLYFSIGKNSPPWKTEQMIRIGLVSRWIQKCRKFPVQLRLVPLIGLFLLQRGQFDFFEIIEQGFGVIKNSIRFRIWLRIVSQIRFSSL